MKKQKLNITTLEVSSFEPQEQVAVLGPVERMTGRTGYCNTCIGACDWTV
ncbi:MAG TPA: hypothetical protein VGC13_25155 [Longimicrobium sp.]|jgi:hypothetical protein